jgi:phosphoglycerol transferase MdoB-like AlkP superfamily enzyme
MSDTTLSRRGGSKRLNPIVALRQTFPYILVGLVLGLLLYNPSGYSLYHLIEYVFFGGAGQMLDANGDPFPFYLQPANISLLIVAVILLGFLYFKWEIARDEKPFLFLYVLLWVLGNLLALALTLMATGNNPFGAAWVQWQVAPAIVSALAFAATLPKVRRAYSGAFTAGGGALDAEDDEED